MPCYTRDYTGLRSSRKGNMIENIIMGFENIVCDADYNRVNAAFNKYGIEGYESFYGAW